MINYLKHYFKCEYCGETFFISTPEIYIYKLKTKNKTIWFHRYDCYSKYIRVLEEKERIKLEKKYSQKKF